MKEEKTKLQKLPDELVPEQIRVKVLEFYANINTAVQQSSAVVVTTDASLEQAGFFLTKFRQLTKASEEIRKELVTPLNMKVKAVNEFFKDIVSRYSAEEKRLEDECNLHLKKKRQLEEEIKAQEQKELEDQILNEAEMFNDVSVIDEIPQVEFKKEKVSETSEFLQTQRVKKWKLADIDKVPRQFMIVNEALIDEIRKKSDFEDKSHIDGIEFYFDEVIKTKGTNQKKVN